MKKAIWTFWDSGGHEPQDSFAKKCAAQWARNCPLWDIKFLDSKTMYDHINRNDLPLNFTSLSPTLRSDFLRLLLLIEHGGLWIDATVKLPENLDWLTRSISKPGTFGFFHHQGYPESWFLYAPEAQDSGLRAWYDSLFKIVHFKHENPEKPFNQSPLYDEVPGYKNIKNNYFMIYVAYVHAMLVPKSNVQQVNALEPVYEFYSHRPLRPLSHRVPQVIKYTKGCRYLKKHKKQIFLIWFFISLLIFLLLLGYFRKLGISLVLGIMAAMVVRCIVISLFLVGGNG